MSPEMWAALGVVLAAAIGFAGIAYTQHSGRRSTEQATAVTFSADLIDRVSALETKVEQLEKRIKTLDSVIRAFSLFVDRIGFWVERGADPAARPRPPEIIHEYIDLTPWRYQGGSGGALVGSTGGDRVAPRAL